ncbi:MAG: type VI secretion protein ImpB [Planctomycetota bacterium]
MHDRNSQHVAGRLPAQDNLSQTPSGQTVAWLFLDLNSFFASCEQHDRPELRGRPVGVCPVLASGGAVIAASYEAKACGVGMGVRAAEARKLCPDITLLQARPARYVELHHSIHASIEKHLPTTKTYSIDEWAIRLLGDERRPERAVELAKRIKQQIADDHDHALPCSVGIAPSRLLAKTACELQKPDGLTVLTMDRMPGILSPMKLRDIPGIGSGMDTRLRQHDITTPEALWQLSKADCRRIWGSVQGEYFWMGYHGHEAEEPKTRRSSMGHAHILPPQYRNDEGAHGIMTRLLCKAVMRCRRDGYYAHRLRVHVSLVGGGSWGEEIALPSVHDTPTVIEHYERLWRRRPWRGGMGTLPGSSEPMPVPLKVSVDLSGLTPEESTPGHLFAQAEKQNKISEVIDRVNRRFKAHALHPGSMTHVVDYAMDDKIAFGRIPEKDIAM